MERQTEWESVEKVAPEDERPQHTRARWENHNTGPWAPGGGGSGKPQASLPAFVHLQVFTAHTVLLEKINMLVCACIGWDWLTFPQQLQGRPAPRSPEGIPLPWVSSQVEDQGQLCVLFLRVGGDS